MKPQFYLIIILFLLTLASDAFAAEKKIKYSLNSFDSVILATTGKAVSQEAGKANVKPPANSSKIVLVDSDEDQAVGPVIFAIKSGRKVYSVAKAKSKGLCEDGAEAVTLVKLNKKSKNGVLNLGSLTVGDDFAYPKRTLPKANLVTNSGLAEVDSDCKPIGAGSLGLTAAGVASRNTASARKAKVLEETNDPAPGADPDQDGMPSAFDADDDNDGVLDNDDEGSSGQGASEDEPTSFWVFSNYHVNLEDSLNKSAMTVSKAQIDAVLTESAGLAIQVVGNGSIDDVEFDCGGLSYCSAGGHGRSKEPYPSGLEFPEGADSDNDGFGTLTPGDTGDFQLSCFGDAPAGFAASDEISAGDVYLQRYTDSKGKVVEVPGMLNFIFHTNPAVKTVVTGVRTYTPSYPVSAGAAGTSGNCFHVPTAGDVSVTLTVWRPQRQGITEAGEAEYMDMGNLRLVTNLPNGPCTSGGGGGGVCETGPGLCPTTVYTESDSNLEIGSDGLQDNLGDQATSSSNTFTYTINISDCVESVSGVSWDAGEYVSLPLQMVNVYGDNTAQNICFVKDNS